jgi:hypothetical protein
MVWILIFAVYVVGLISPILIEAYHWWPRKRKPKKNRVRRPTAEGGYPT